MQQQPPPQTAPGEQDVLVDPRECPSCGELVEEGDRFCEACGYEIDAPATMIGQPQAEADPLGRLARLWPLIAILWVLLAIVAGVWIYGRAILLE